MSIPIAIVGFSARLPGGNTLEEIDRFLVSGKSAVATWDRESMLAAGVEESELDQGQYVARSARVDWSPTTDPFGVPYSAHEREITDPQHLLFLELAAEALKDAGVSLAEARGGEIACVGGVGMGLFAGERLDSYFMRSLLRNSDRLQSTISPEVLVGNSPDHAVGRVAHRLGLTGPCVNIQTACSTSFAAIDYAVQLLRSGRVDMALAGAVSMFFPETRGYHWTRGSILSEAGICRAFDARADGTVGGSGGAIFALKRLDAVSPDDTVHGVIEGIALGSDGAQRVSYTAPSYEGQARVIRAALRDADLSANEIDYVETHGTGTPVGDLVELSVLDEVFGERGSALAVGSIKPALGHLDTAAGAASLVNVILGMRRGFMPGTVNFERLNDALADVRLHVSAEAVQFPPTAGRVRVGISSFGASGTSTHMIVSTGRPHQPAPWGAERLSTDEHRPSQSAMRTLAPSSRESVPQGEDGTALANLIFSIRERRPVDDVTDDQLAAMGLIDLGLDSVDVVAIAALVEARWEVRLDVFDLLTMPDVHAIATAISTARGEATE